MRPGFREHQDRSAALEEAHARPSLPVPIPATLHHLAFSVTGEEAAAALYRLVFAAAPVESERHVIRDEGGLVLKWERHTEFVSLTIRAGDDGGRADPLLDHLARSAPREVALLVALRVHVVPASAGVEAVGPIGGRIAGGIGVGTTFQPGADGFIDWHLTAPAIGAAQLGRRVQRVLEAETYRTITLLGLPLARRVGPQLTALEGALAGAIDALVRDADSDAAVLERLQRLSAEIEALRVSTRFRFSASRAYAALVEERLASLAEEKIGERSTVTGFMGTRLAPAVRSIESMEARQAELSGAVERALGLLRARVDVSLNRANQGILRSMNERQHRQLILSEAVESLSVIAISYYLLGILGYPVKSLIDLGWLPGTPTLVLGVLAPFVLVLVFWALRRLRARWHGGA